MERRVGVESMSQVDEVVSLVVWAKNRRSRHRDQNTAKKETPYSLAEYHNLWKQHCCTPPLRWPSWSIAATSQTPCSLSVHSDTPSSKAFCHLSSAVGSPVSNISFTPSTVYSLALSQLCSTPELSKTAPYFFTVIVSSSFKAAN